MFPLWKLVLLCGLLTGTSASLIEDLENEVLEKLKALLEKRIETSDSTLQALLQKLVDDLKALEESKSQANAFQMIQDVKTLLEEELSEIFQVVYKVTGLNIRNVHILDISVTSDGKRLSLSIPINADISYTLPLLGKVVDLGLNLDLQATVSAETDDTTGDVTVVVECTSDQDSISLTVLNRRIALINKAVDAAVNFVRQVLSLAVEYAVCPVLQTLIGLLDANYVQDLIDWFPGA
ncbi:short palate, lung and nasal epithelium carcinoma-associated protein 2B-like [Hippopotamus amphibius kiboko]|uniref:short palate, lung and nasal epithelium carcinoma-associated protein 2B-like n=1 Tax=Hippopotamus amphibius kiboko TaxID=575201 RepID=UPI00259369C7|nr:short palate, lung and nasal epithelium carcinoma-associated protein 2B-like [Hippopotamus amphibius kiboko]